MYRELKDRKGESSVLTNMGFTYGQMGLIEKAAERVGMRRAEFAKCATIAAARALVSPELLNASPVEIRCQP